MTESQQFLYWILSLLLQNFTSFTLIKFRPNHFVISTTVLIVHVFTNQSYFDFKITDGLIISHPTNFWLSNHAFDSAINAFNSSLLLLVLSIAAIIARNSIINSLSGLASHFALLDNYPSTVFKFKQSLNSEAALLKSLL